MRSHLALAAMLLTALVAVGGPIEADTNSCVVDLAQHQTTCTFHCHPYSALDEHYVYVRVLAEQGSLDPVQGTAECGSAVAVCAGVASCSEWDSSVVAGTGVCRLLQGAWASCGDSSRPP